MALRTKIKNLFIPRKTQDPAKQPGYGTDMRAIEQWALEVLNYLNNNGIVEIVAGANVTVTNGFGPVVTIAASGGGGGGITTLASPDGSITITNPTGPTTDVDVEGWPFPPFADGLFNVGYGPTVLANITTGDFNTAVGESALNADTSGSSNAAFGHNALPLLTTGTDNTSIGAGSSGRITSGGGNTGVGEGCLGAVTTTTGNTAVGFQAGGVTSTGQLNTSIGYAVSPASSGLSGTVQIGVDNSNTPAQATNSNDWALGTALHVIVFSNTHTGSTTTTLGTNSPSVGTTPRGWIKIRDSSNNIGYIPYWV